MNKKITASLILYTSALVAGAAPSLLSIKDTIHDNTIVYPESFETDTKKMLENWYLQNYAVLDKAADEKASVRTSDEDLIERLGKMPTVIEMPYNSIVRACIDRYANNRKQLIENMLGLSLYYMPIFEQALDKYGLPLELKYLPIVESALDPSAVSRAGATGLWQFMLPTANGLGLEVNSIVDQRRDPYSASEAAAKYLKQLYETFNDWSLAIAAYNCGPGNINKALRRAGGGKKDFWEIYPYLPQETRGYVPTFIAANYIMNYYNMHNISPALAKKPIVTDTVHVTKRVHFDQISEVMNIPKNELRLLNPQYREDVIPGDIKPYTLVLPSLQVYAYIANEDSIVNHNAALYARRDIVQPATAAPTASDTKGEYVEEQVTKYHTVKKGETLAKIARKYGVTTSSIRKANNCGKSVSAGRRLKIVTTKRTYVPKTDVPADTTEIVSSAPRVEAPEQQSTTKASKPVAKEKVEAPIEESKETTNAKSSDVEEMVETVQASEQRKQVAGAMNASAQKQKQVEKKKETAKESKAKNKKKAQVTHKVKSGENLYKISKKYGITVQELKNANGIKSDDIKIGQSLTIPSK
jgi:membrane-bound lytic murein transglycosylase D